MTATEFLEDLKLLYRSLWLLCNDEFTKNWVTNRVADFHSLCARPSSPSPHQGPGNCGQSDDSTLDQCAAGRNRGTSEFLDVEVVAIELSIV